MPSRKNKATRGAALRQRIVSLAPSSTSILVQIGARKQLVGVTRWCKDVADVRGLPALGDCWSMDVGKMLALKPTLIIGSVPYKTETVAEILKAPVAFLAMNPRTLADVYSDIRMLGGIAGRVAAAERLVRRMQKEFARVAAASRRRKQAPLRVYCEAWPNPRISSPHWVEELVAMAGGKMVAPAGQRVSEEQIIRAAPEVIVLAWAATGIRSKPEELYANPAWVDVPAIVTRQVHVVRDEWLNTPGPPLVRGANELARLFRAAPSSHPSGKKETQRGRRR